MFPYLVADIGGTNARFAVVKGKGEQGYIIEHVKILAGADFSSFSAAIENYLASISVRPVYGCIAIAGPVDGDSIKMTNLDWAFSKTALENELGFEKFEIINDYTALALATTQLRDIDVITLKQGEQTPFANKAIFGPGTGLGVAGLIHSSQGWVAIPSEGGHVNLAPTSSFESQVIIAGLSQFGHLSAESFLSGPGLVNLYSAVCEVNGVSRQEYLPKDVTANALSNSDEQCVVTLNTFCSLMGAFAGNLALTYGAKGGVYITGGIVPRMIEFVKNSGFVTQFCDKGVMSHYVEPIPVYVVNHTESAFLGAAACIDQVVN